MNILFALGVVLNSCISEKVEEKVPDTDDPIIDDPEPDVEKEKTFYFRFLPDQALDSETINTYAGPSFNGSTPILRWGNSESTGVFVTGSDGVLLFYKKYDFNSTMLIVVDKFTTALKTASAYGYTPHHEYISGTTVSYTLDNVQNQSADNSTESKMDTVLYKNVFTIAPPNSFDLDEGMGVMTYKSIFAFLRLDIKKSSTTTIFEQQKVKNVELYVADTTDIEKPVQGYNLAGNYTIDVSKAPGTSGYSGPIFSPNTSFYKITSSVTGGDFISDAISSPYLWFVINPIKIKPSERLISIIETTSGFKIASKHDIPQLNPNTVYTLKIDATEDNTASSQIQLISDGNISNCHIVSSAGIYRMYLKKISGGALTGDNVSWLWASKDGGSASFDIKDLIDPASISYDKTSGYVDFRVGSELGKLTKGNVILALKDQAGEIVWTWHIWITDKPGDYTYEGGKTLLDRNLGALSAEMVSTGIDNYGFVYQWGRKDPFFGGNGSENETTANMPFATSHTIRNGSVWAVNDNAGYRTIDMARKNPMTFIVNSTSPNNEYADWLLASDATCWSAFDKTDNDPCPAGYKVPARNDLASLYEVPNDPPPPALFYFKNAGRKYWEYNFYTNNKVTVWPAAGMRLGRGSAGEYNGGQLIFSGTTYTTGQCFYWTSNFFTEGASYRVYTVGNKLYSADDHGDRADAYAVRCVKMTNP